MKKYIKRKIGRSGREICPTCSNKCPLVEHHINGRKIQGWNKSWNIAWVCATCHDLVHSGDIVIEGWISTSSGLELSWHSKNKPNQFLEPSTPNLYK